MSGFGWFVSVALLVILVAFVIGHDCRIAYLEHEIERIERTR